MALFISDKNASGACEPAVFSLELVSQGYRYWAEAPAPCPLPQGAQQPVAGQTAPGSNAETTQAQYETRCVPVVYQSEPQPGEGEQGKLR